MRILVGLMFGAIVELYVMYLVATWIGFWPMLGILILLSIVGFAVIRMAGVRTMRRYMEQSATGEPPGKQLADGAVMLTSGLLLAVPGFVSGAFGLVLLLPPGRALMRTQLSKRTASAAQRFTTRGGLRGTTVIATYDRDEVRDVTATDVAGELPPSDDR